MRQYIIYIIAFWTLALTSAWAATLSVRQQSGNSNFSATLGEIVDMEVVIDSGIEEVTGFTFFLSYDNEVFRIVEDDLGVPFRDGEFLPGLILLNRRETIDGETILGFSAATGVQRQAVSGEGVVAHFQLEVLRRPPGDESFIVLGDWGHDRQTHFFEISEPGVEKRFITPLGVSKIHLTGFRIQPFPAVTLIDGESQVMFDLDDFVDQDDLDVLWTVVQPTPVAIRIDPETNVAIADPEIGLVGQQQISLVALEIGEGLTASRVVDITILSRPQIKAFPDTLIFLEDQARTLLNLDAFVQDLDDLPESLNWTLVANNPLAATIDPETRDLSLSADPDWFGAEILHLTVADKDGLVDTVSATVHVIPVNDPPVAYHHGPLYIELGSEVLAVPLNGLVEDIDDSVEATTLTLDLIGSIAAEVQGDTLLLLSGLELGRGIVRYALEDPNGERATGQLVAVVIADTGNIAPEILHLPSLVFNNTESLDVDLSQRIQDDDALENLTLIVSASQGLVADIVEGRLQIAVSNGFSGSGQVELQVIDNDGNQDTKIIDIEALPADQPVGPLLIGPAKLGILQGQEKLLPLASLMPQASDMSWEFSASEGIIPVLSTTGDILRLQVQDGFNGPGVLKLTASDVNGQSSQITVPVLVAQKGESPRVLSIPPLILEGIGASQQFDLDDYVFDDMDLDSELFWTAIAEAGVEIILDPISHKLTVIRGQNETATDVVQVLLQVRDTAGLENSLLLRVELPLLFEVRNIPALHFFSGQVDSSLILNDFIDAAVPISLIWEVLPAEHLVIDVKPTTGEVTITTKDARFQGAETVFFVAKDSSQRQYQVPVEVIVQGKGLIPEVRPLEKIELLIGEVGANLDLDDFVIDDDLDDALIWEVIGVSELGAEIQIDSTSHILKVDATQARAGYELVPLLVSDPAGNFSQVNLEIIISQTLQAPVIAILPRLIVPAGGEVVSLGLDVFVSDENDPDAALAWQVEAPAGIAARIENRRLLVSVPTALSGERVLQLKVTDPEGNQALGEVRLVIDADTDPPSLFLSVRRHPVFEELQVFARSDEELSATPTIRIDSVALAVEQITEDNLIHRGAYPIVPVTGAQRVELRANGIDRGGNTAERILPLSIQWFDAVGGSLVSPDHKLVMNVPQAATAPGRLGMIYRLDEGELPAASEGYEVYWVELAREQDLGYPVTINAFVGNADDMTLGLLRWNASEARWEELVTGVDPVNSWLTARVKKLGFFRVGTVQEENRIEQITLGNFPNPFPTATMDETQIVYELDVAGPVQLSIFNGLGQGVRRLVDEPFQQSGIWTVVWDGTDQYGQRLASGIYFYELYESGRRHQRTMMLVR